MNNQSKNNDIIQIAKRASDLEIRKPPAPPSLASGTLSGIHNAWLDCAIVDPRGMIWVSAERLNIILRTTPANARYILDSILSEHKSEKDGKIFVQGPEIIRTLDKTIQSAGSIKRGKYARYSEKIYRSIRDSNYAQLIRAEFYEYIEGYKHKLKQLRINKRSVVTDELTGSPLNQKGSQFSHIRSVSVYPHLADRMWNGLVVNNKTHKVITDNSANDEGMLLNLRSEHGWNTGWYDEFVKNLRTTWGVETTSDVH